MFHDDDFLSASGVLLSREFFGESRVQLKLFLKDIGIIYATARKSSGETEPFVWGKFSLQKKQKGKSYFVQDTEIIDDMYCVRAGRNKILTALNWTKLISQHLLSEQPDNDLLANLYWNLKLLCIQTIPEEAVNWRFLWKWIEIWGLAPDFVKFHIAMNFNDNEIILLAKIIESDFEGVVNIFSTTLENDIRENIFRVAAKTAVKFLHEK